MAIVDHIPFATGEELPIRDDRGEDECHFCGEFADPETGQLKMEVQRKSDGEMFNVTYCSDCLRQHAPTVLRAAEASPDYEGGESGFIAPVLWPKGQFVLWRRP